MKKVVGSVILLSCTLISSHFAFASEIKDLGDKHESYEVTYVETSKDKGLSGVSFPTWSEKNGQDDIRWYQGKKIGNKWVAKIPIKNHKDLGKYLTHTYGIKKGKLVGLANDSFVVPRTSYSPKVMNVNQSEGTFDVVVRSNDNTEIERAFIPIWSTRDQNDIQWYRAEKQEDGSFIAHMNVKNHKFNAGTYTIHAYMDNKNGTNEGIVVGEQNIQEPQEKLSISVQPSSDESSYTIDAELQNSGFYTQPEYLYVPTWSEKDGQDDIKWYQAKRQSNGHYVQHVNISDHKTSGRYFVHVYRPISGRNSKFMGLTEFEVTGASLQGSVSNIDESKGTFDVLLHANTKSGVKSLSVPVWSRPDQTDIVWYQAEKQNDGSYAAHVNIKNHNYNRGIYHVHSYLDTMNGLRSGIIVGDQAVKETKTEMSGQITNINEGKGTFDVVIDAANQDGIDNVRVPVWSRSDQTDIKWYQAEKQQNGQYVVHADVSNHNNNPGVYTVHAYANSHGKSSGIVVGNVNMAGNYYTGILKKIAESSIAQKTDQIVTVIAASGSNAQISLFDKVNGKWQQTLSTNGFVGSQGIGEGSEYASRTPKGAYRLGFAFGMNGNPGTKLPYRQITQNSYWISNVNDPQYNTWQERSSSSPADEHLASHPQQYEFGITLDYDHGVGGGSAFYLHVTNNRPTAGCIAVSRPQMLYFMQNIHQGAYIVNMNNDNELLK